MMWPSGYNPNIYIYSSIITYIFRLHKLSLSRLGIIHREFGQTFQPSTKVRNSLITDVGVGHLRMNLDNWRIHTPRQFNIALRNRQSQKEAHLPTTIFHGLAGKLPGGIQQIAHPNVLKLIEENALNFGRIFGLTGLTWISDADPWPRCQGDRKIYKYIYNILYISIWWGCTWDMHPMEESLRGPEA